MNLSEKERENTLFLVDVSSFIFRAFFAIRGLSSSKGEPTNAVYGVGSMLGRLIEDAKPDFLTIVYDSKEPSFRKEEYPEYKANRSAVPEELIPQFDRIEDLIQKMGFHSIRESGVEADDLIGTMTQRWLDESPHHRVMLVTGDKDLMQLVSERVSVWDTMKNVVFTPKEVEEKFGIPPSQVRDYLALVGDSSDNIPGVPSIGPKGAVDLLKEFSTLEHIVEAAKSGKIKGKKCEAIAAHEKEAYLSQKLATLRFVERIQVDLHLMRSPFRDGLVRVGPECLALLSSLDLHSLANKWRGGGMVEASPAVESEPIQEALQYRDGIFTTIDTEEKLQALLKKLEDTLEFGFDLETTSLNPREAQIVGISISTDLNSGVYIPVGHIGANLVQLSDAEVLSKLRPFLEDPKRKKVGHNLKYDFSVLTAHGIHADGIGADTMVADYVLDPEGRHNLETVAMKHLSYKVFTFEEVCGRGKDQITFDLVPIETATRYSAEDAWVSLNLWNVLKKKLTDKGLMRIFSEVDSPLVQVLSDMEMTGVSIDAEYLKTLGKEFTKEILEIDEQIQKYTKGPVNLNSPKQLAQLLFEELKLPTQTKTKTGYSTDASVLEILAPLHIVPRLILQHREVAKLFGTYVEPLPQLRDQKTGKIHASFHQTVTATGRLSSSDPNLQNIPVRSLRGQKIRRAFIASPGRVLLSADYSQIELRLLAQMSGDADLVDSFNKGEDVHRRTAAEIYHIAPEAVSDEQRSIAKAINFGLMYGKTPFGLAAELGISRTQAKEMIDRYFRRYQGVKQYLDSLIVSAKETGVTETLLGRKRELKEIHSKNPAVRANAERMAMNTPIQGTAADLMKLGMIRVADFLKQNKLKSKLIIQVHDEVVLDCVRDELDQLHRGVREALEGAFCGIVTLKVPLKANLCVGDNWMDL